MNTQAMCDALNAIHDVALSALSDDMSTQTRENIQLILSIARHKTDVRTTDERQTKDTK